MPGYVPPTTTDDIQPVLDKVTGLDANPPARFSFTQEAFDMDDVESPTSFSLSNKNNIPTSSQTDYTSNVLDQGNRAQASSIPRMAVNHFFGRFSYNLAKLAQQFLAFIVAIKKAFAHNSFEYDHAASYLTGDVCYVTRTVRGKRVIERYERTGTSPLSISGISPLVAGQSDWERTDPKEFPSSAVGIIIPMYIYPGDIYNNTTYNSLIDLAKQYHEVPLHVILNPDTGPGTGGIDGNYTVAIKRLHGAGIKVYGYIHCAWGATALATVRDTVVAWQTRYPEIDGIFLDEMPSTLAYVAYVKSIKEAAEICAFPVLIGNAGTVSPYHGAYIDAGAVDVIINYENSAVPLEADLKGDMDGGYMSYDYHRRGALLYAQGSFNSSLFAMMSKYVGMLYITDAAAGWAVWNTVSSYMVSMLSALTARNGAVLATPYTVVQRDYLGRSQITNPTNDADITNKGSVNTLIAALKTFFQTNSLASIAAPTVGGDIVNKTYADAIKTFFQTNSLASIAAPTVGGDIVNKTYADAIKGSLLLRGIGDGTTYTGNIDSINTNGIYNLLTGFSGTLPPGANSIGDILVQKQWDANARTQEYWIYTTNKKYIRTFVSSSWNVWMLQATTDDVAAIVAHFDPMSTVEIMTAEYYNGNIDDISKSGIKRLSSPSGTLPPGANSVGDILDVKVWNYGPGGTGASVQVYYSYASGATWHRSHMGGWSTWQLMATSSDVAAVARTNVHVSLVGTDFTLPDVAVGATATFAYYIAAADSRRSMLLPSGGTFNAVYVRAVTFSATSMSSMVGVSGGSGVESTAYAQGIIFYTRIS
jgi:hypothetical protein